MKNIIYKKILKKYKDKRRMSKEGNNNEKGVFRGRLLRRENLKIRKMHLEEGY